MPSRERGKEACGLSRRNPSELALAEHGGDERLELSRGQHGVDAGLRGRLFGAQPTPRPVFLGSVRFLDEEDGPTGFVARHQHEHRARLGDAREVIEIAVLAILVLDVR